MKTIVNEAFIEASIDETVHCVILTLNGFIKSAEFRSSLNRCIESASYNKLNKWIVDARKFKNVSYADLNWLVSEFVPKGINSNILKYNALIISQSVFGNISIESVFSRITDNKMIKKYFDNMESAKDWIRVF